MRTTYLIFSTPDLALAGMDSCFAFVRVDQHSIAKSVQRRAQRVALNPRLHTTIVGAVAGYDLCLSVDL